MSAPVVSYVVPAGAPIPKETPSAETFIVFDAISQPDSIDIHGNAEFTFVNNSEIDINFRRYTYRGTSFRDQDISAHFAFQLSPEKYYAGFGYLKFANNYGYPPLGGLGVGLLKLPLLDKRFSFGGSLWYYPNVSGAIGSYVLAYKALQFDLGVTYGWKRVFLNAGYLGDRLNAKANTPGSVSHSGGRAGLGIRL